MRSSGRVRSKLQTISSINITPLVDVMLVLLVIFMIAAPLMHHGVPVQLPSADAPSLEAKTKPVTLTLTPDHKIYLGSLLVLQENLKDALTKAAPHKNQPIYLKADKNISYGAVIQLMAALNKLGYTQIALISEAKKL